MVGEPPVQGFWLPGGGVDCRRAALRPGVGWCGCPSGPVIMAACHCGFGSADSALCQSAVLVCAAMACRHSPGVAAGIFQNLPYWLAKRPVSQANTGRFAAGQARRRICCRHRWRPLTASAAVSRWASGGCEVGLPARNRPRGARPSGRRLRANVARLLEPRLLLRPRAAHGMPAATVAGMGRQGGRQTAWLI